MAKKRTVREIEPEEISQETPDEEPARVIDEDEPEANGLAGHSKTDLIREAVEAGYEKPARGVKYIREKHGVEIDSKYYSIVKGKLGKSGDKPESAPAAVAPQRSVAPTLSSSPAGAVPASLFDDLKQLRQIKDRYGDDFQKIVDAIG